MKQDHDFTKRLGRWLDTPEQERDLEEGALLLLKLNNNQLMYRNLRANLKGNAKFLERSIKQYYNFRLQSLTREEVKEMEARVNVIVESHHSFALPKTEEPADAQQTSSDSVQDFRKGKRADHDELPEEIQALYVENLDVMRRMRETHMQLRHLSSKDAPCPASDRYPFLKELIRLDKLYHENWFKYDNYKLGTPVEAPIEAKEDVNEASLKAVRQINLMKGRYKKNPTEEMKAKMLELYAKVLNPTPKLVAELTDLGIIKADEA